MDSKLITFSSFNPGLILFLCSVCSLSCSSTNDSPREAMADYYWRAQVLRMEANSDTRATKALLELGLIYLKTGNLQEANEAFTLAISQDRSNPKLWFYSGLSQEFLGNRTEALSRLKRAPGRSQNSVYSQAIKGRIAWLEEFELLENVANLANSEEAIDPGSTLRNLHVLKPINCNSAIEELDELGLGLTTLIAHDLDQIQGIDFFDVGLTRIAYEQSSGLPESAVKEQALWAAKLFNARKFISNSCDISPDGTIQLEFNIIDISTENEITLSLSENINNISELETSMIDNLLSELRIYVPNRERRMPAAGLSLEALKLLSDAIRFESEGEFSRSIQHYDQVLRMHPNFTTARVSYEKVSTKELSLGKSNAELYELLYRLESTSSNSNLLSIRSQNARSGFNKGFFIGPEARKIPPGAVGELPLPPNPTGN